MISSYLYATQNQILKYNLGSSLTGVISQSLLCLLFYCQAQLILHEFLLYCSTLVVKVSTYFQQKGYKEVAKGCKKRQIAGAHLLQMYPKELQHWGIASKREVSEAMQSIVDLQTEYECPLIARWSVSDVSDWLEHHSFTAVRFLHLLLLL